MSEPMDIKDYIPERLRFLQIRKQELALEQMRIDAAIAELLNMVQPAEPEPPKGRKAK